MLVSIGTAFILAVTLWATFSCLSDFAQMASGRPFTNDCKTDFTLAACGWALTAVIAGWI